MKLGQVHFRVVVTFLFSCWVLAAPAWGQSVSTGGGRATRVATAAAIGPTACVAVLPFANLSQNPADEWLRVGIAKTVMAGLDKLPGVSIVHPGPTQQAARRWLPAPEIDSGRLLTNEPGRELAATWVVRGAYQRAGDHIRITASLVDARDGAPVQAVEVDGTISEVFALQDRMVTELARHLPVGRDTELDVMREVGTTDAGEVARLATATAKTSADGPRGRVSADDLRPTSLAPSGTLELDGAAIGAGETPPVSAATTEAITFGPPPSEAALPPRERYRIEPRRVDQAPRLDASLDEEVWRTAAVIDDFVQQEPSEGDPATERTVVRMLYDARTLYIGLEAFDSDPEGVIATEMRRDSRRLFDEDNFQIILDTFRDSRSGYMFVTNPLGGKLEQQVSEEGDGGFRTNSSNINVNWDGVWHVAARRTSEGWVAEIAIPLVTIRFPEAERQVWGVNFMRNIRHKNEQVFWAPIPKAYSLTRVSLAGTLTGLNSVNRGMDLRITPYVLAGGRQDRVDTGLDGSGFNDVGLDVKYGVASGLNLDLTVNTDFAQVEVDEQQVNLTRFPLFFPEKRDFFLENAGLFSMTTQGTDRFADLFFTRRIGLSATGQPIPIVGGSRLTGKVARHNIAVMDIHTQAAFGEPAANFFVARYSRDILVRSKVGGLVINKEAVDDSRYNRTFATDTTLALHPNFTMNAFLAKTQTPGISTGDMAGYLRAFWLSPSWQIYGEYVDLQDNFNAEVGFVPRVGIRTTKLHGEWDPRPGKWNIRQLNPMMNIAYTTDQHNRLLSRRIHHMVGTRFENGANFTVIYNDYLEQLDEPFRLRRDVIIPAGAYRFGEWRVSYSSDPSRRFYGRLRYSPQTFFDGTRTDVNASLGVRATSRIAAEGQFRRSNVEVPWGAFVADLGSIRFDLALSPQMTLRTLSQYNSSTDEISTSVRFNWIYKPGSDIYIAYDELRMDVPGVPWLRNRQLAVKMTYLVSR